MDIAMLADGCSGGQAAGGVRKQKAAQRQCHSLWLPVLFFLTFVYPKKVKMWRHGLV